MFILMHKIKYKLVTAVPTRSPIAEYYTLLYFYKKVDWWWHNGCLEVGREIYRSCTGEKERKHLWQKRNDVYLDN